MAEIDDRWLSVDEICKYLLSIPLYVRGGTNGDGQTLESTIEAWQVGRVELKKQSRKRFTALADIGISCYNEGEL